MLIALPKYLSHLILTRKKKTATWWKGTSIILISHEEAWCRESGELVWGHTASKRLNGSVDLAWLHELPLNHCKSCFQVISEGGKEMQMSLMSECLLSLVLPPHHP